jgi:hypothetical protein
MADTRRSARSEAASDVSPPPASRAQPPTARRRILVASVLALASVLLVLSVTANWVQADALDTGWVTDASKQIVENRDVQEALAIYGVDQLFANVDVRREIERRLPSPAKALAAPAAAATRQLALDLERRALSSPRVQEVVTRAIGFAHAQFVALVTDREGYLATTNGEVTLAYGQVIADLAVRLGVDARTVSDIRQVARKLEGLEPRLTEVQTRVRSARSELARIRGGELSPETRQRIGELQARVAEARDTVAGLRANVGDISGRSPPPLARRFDRLEAGLSALGARLGSASDRLLGVLDDPRAVQAGGVDVSLGRIDARLDTLLGRQLVQSPGELVILRSTQLEGVQTLMSVLRGLGLLLPILVVALYALAIYLARGWRPRALLGAGVGIVSAALLVLVARRVIGGEILSSLASSAAVEPALQFVWDTLSQGLRERAYFVLAVGVAVAGGGLVSGPGRRATAARHFLAPFLVEHRAAVYSLVGLLFLLWLAFSPGTLHAGQLLAVGALAVAAFVGIEALRRQVASEFPNASRNR